MFLFKCLGNKQACYPHGNSLLSFNPSYKQDKGPN